MIVKVENGSEVVMGVDEKETRRKKKMAGKSEVNMGGRRRNLSNQAEQTYTISSDVRKSSAAVVIESRAKFMVRRDLEGAHGVTFSTRQK